MGCREREIAVIVSEVGVEGLRPVMPGVFILRKWQNRGYDRPMSLSHVGMGHGVGLLV